MSITTLKSEGGAYGFAGLPAGTCYSNETNVDVKTFGGAAYSQTSLKAMHDNLKAQNGALVEKAFNTQTGGVGTAGYAMIPVYVDPRVVDRTRKYTPLVAIIPRITNQGITADYNVITAKGGATTLSEDAALTETNTTPDRQSTAIKYIYAVGRVTGQAVAGVPSYNIQGVSPAGGATGAFNDQAAANAKQFEVIVKAQELREKEEDLIINGNATTSAADTVGVLGVDGTEFDGIITLMGATNTVDKNTSALEWDDIELACRYAFDDSGRPTVAVGSSDAVNDVRKIMIDVMRWTAPQSENMTLGFGVPTAIDIYTCVGRVTLFPSQFMSNTTGSKAIYFLDLSVWEMRVMQDITFFDLAKNNDSDKFALKVYEALICKAPAFNSSITEISA